MAAIDFMCREIRYSIMGRHLEIFRGPARLARLDLCPQAADIVRIGAFHREGSRAWAPLEGDACGKKEKGAGWRNVATYKQKRRTTNYNDRNNRFARSFPMASASGSVSPFLSIKRVASCTVVSECRSARKK